MKNKKRLFVDCQVFQHNTWNRGMGRYTLKLMEAIDKEPVDLTLIFNKNIPLEHDRLDAVKKACPAAKILYLSLSDNPNKHGGWLGLQKVCSKELDAQLSSLLKPSDTYLVASNFSIRYCSTFPGLSCNKAVIFWDITPYLQWSDFKNTPDFEPKKYFAQFDTLFTADQLWAISQSAAEEVELILGIHASKVINIRGASIRNMEERVGRPKSVAADLRFLICPSADGPHKNNENMARAFALFNAKSNDAYSLVITSDFSDQTKDMLHAISPSIIFTGHVSDGELGWLYENCQALLFASKTEGLGLPILEAVAAGKKVICSDIKVFKEISRDAFYMADPKSIQAIQGALEAALIDDTSWDSKKTHYEAITDMFSWPSSARECIEAMGQVSAAYEQQPKISNAVLWYADSDKLSLSRDIAEVSMPILAQGTKFRAIRNVHYSYEQPSYLLDMGIARNALESGYAKKSTNIYVIDDSNESGLLLLSALQSPGLLCITYSDKKEPKEITSYLESLYGGKIDYNTFMRLLQQAGNRMFHKNTFSKRGTKAFIDEVSLLNTEFAKGDTN